MVKHTQIIRRQFLDYDCKWLYTLKSVFVQFRRNFKGPPFYSGGFSEQKKKLMKYYYFIRTLKIDQDKDKRYFLRKSFHKSQVKFENMKKTKQKQK